MTPKQKKVLDFIKDYWAENGYAPSYRDIGEGMRMKSMSHVFSMVKQLHERGYITKMKERARSIKVADY